MTWDQIIMLAVTAVLLVVIALWLLALYGLNQWTRPARALARDHPRNYNLPFEDVTFTSRDGVQLRGWLILPPPPTPPPFGKTQTGEGSSQSPRSPSPAQRHALREVTQGERAGVGVIFCHGHAGTKAPDLIYAPWFYERGIPVLLFDFRGHGLSDGTFTSMGYYERQDLLGAIDYMAARGYSRLGLFGFSLGGAVAIATTPLSEHVACVVTDSPFAELRPTLARAICVHGFPRWFAERFIHLIFWLAQRRLGCDFDEAAPMRAVQQFGERPLLIILGDQDEYIEPWQGRLLYEKASGPKEFWLVPGVSHRDSDRYRPEQYRERVMGFFERWLL